MMVSWTFFWIAVTISCYPKVTNGFKNCLCPNGCHCSKMYQDLTVVDCLDVVTFPSFTYCNESISYVTIEGSYTDIPAYGFYNLTNIYYGLVFARSDAHALVPITVDQDAFRFSGWHIISVSFANFKGMTDVPSDALSGVTLSDLYFYDCFNGFTYLSSNAFDGLKTYMIRIEKCRLFGVDDDALVGVQIFNKTGLTVDMSNNGFSAMLNCVATPGITSLSLADNGIYSIPDFSFACPGGPPSCNKNGTLQKINLNKNPLASEKLGLNAFANLPYLTTLSLINTGLNSTSVLINILTPVAQHLTYLDVEFNGITDIQSGSFRNFGNLITLNFHGNPISQIEVGAFAGMNKMTSLFLDDMDNLTNVDLAISSGMQVVQQVVLSYGALQHVYLSDVSLLPRTLKHVDVSHSYLSTMDSSIGAWLSNTSNTLDLSHNANFNCSTDISWMAPYVLCTYQIITDNQTTCASSNEPLAEYLLKTFSPPCYSTTTVAINSSPSS